MEGIFEALLQFLAEIVFEIIAEIVGNIVEGFFPHIKSLGSNYNLKEVLRSDKLVTLNISNRK